MELLIGQAADPGLTATAYRLLAAEPTIDTVLALPTMQLSPDDVLLVARVDLADGLDSDGVEETSGRIKASLQARIPAISQVFLDITDASDDDREAARRKLAALVEAYPGLSASGVDTTDRSTAGRSLAFLAGGPADPPQVAWRRPWDWTVVP